ncbi:unnamed protein product [Aphanomyces euteiches]
MADSLPVRLHIRVRTFEVACNPRSPAEALLIQARELSDIDMPLDALFNKTRQAVIDLRQPLASSASPHDDIEARSSHGLRDDSFVRQLPTGLRVDPADALFYQQLCAFNVVGQKQERAAARKERESRRAALKFASLLRAYHSYSGSFDDSLTSARRKPVPERLTKRDPTVKSPKQLVSPPYSPDASAFLTDDSSSSDESETTKSPKIDPHAANNVFDVVFTQTAIGLKLIMDSTKTYATVRECLAKSEASRYDVIQPGVAVLAVNGQQVVGLGLSRTLAQLRAAPRPVVVRFGHVAASSGASWHDSL